MKTDRPYLLHILDAIKDIECFLGNISRDEFFKNKEKQYAVIKALEIIGEATKQIHPILRKQHPEIPWTDMMKMRDKLIHAYFGIKVELVWETIKSDLPKLKQQLSKVPIDAEN